MRAETAANFGREIGLQYCHAHIRYCEALAKVGNGDDLYKALLTINPVRLHENVVNALPRQRNAYYSSSDGDFLNRYDANANFDKLKDGSVGVKGGWRVYSSGPGIYLNQIISHFLGIRVSGDKLIIDPVVATSLKGLVASMDVLGHQLTINYVDNQEEKILVNGLEVNYEVVSNKYRSTGLQINLADLSSNANITFKI
jgi:cellobiose phosphorylase